MARQNRVQYWQHSRWNESKRELSPAETKTLGITESVAYEENKVRKTTELEEGRRTDHIKVVALSPNN